MAPTSKHLSVATIRLGLSSSLPVASWRAGRAHEMGAAPKLAHTSVAFWAHLHSQDDTSSTFRFAKKH